jgi:hypothetical protein
MRALIAAQQDRSICEERLNTMGSSGERYPERVRSLEASRNQAIARMEELEALMDPPLVDAALEAANGTRTFTISPGADAFRAYYNHATGQTGPVPAGFEFGFISPDGAIRVARTARPVRSIRVYLPSERETQPGLGSGPIPGQPSGAEPRVPP